MSGGGSSIGMGGGGNESPCDALRFEAQLTSPQPGVVGTLKVNEVLDVAVNTQKELRIVQVLRGLQVAGGLTGPDATRLRTCIDEGHHFKATVIAVNGGQVRVKVEHV